MKKILIIIMCIFLFGCNKTNKNISINSKKVNIQKKSYYAFRVKSDDYISVRNNEESITKNINNNLEDDSDILYEDVSVFNKSQEDNISEDASDFSIAKETINEEASDFNVTGETINEEESNEKNMTKDVLIESSIAKEDINQDDNQSVSLMSTESIEVKEENTVSINSESDLKNAQIRLDKDNKNEGESKIDSNESNISQVVLEPEIKKGYYTPRGTYLGDSKVKVIDISYHQGIIDFDSFINSDSYYGIILRIGYYNIMDKLFERNINEIKRLNIPYGIYLFSYAINSNEANMEADFTNNIIDKYDLHPTLGIYYDIESFKTNKKNSDNITKDTYDSIIYTYINKVSNHINNLYKVKVYSGRWYAMNRLGSISKSYVDWVAEYNKTCKYDLPYSMWQYTSKGSVPGINGNVDISYLY